MKKVSQERRKSQRYDTALKVYYQVTYDVSTKVKFQFIDSVKPAASRKYSGVSRNVSVDGLCFEARKKLNKHDRILLEVYAPNTKTPVHMQAEVRWAHSISRLSSARVATRAGVEIVSVEGKSVARSLHFDKKYRVAWSLVLDSLFSNFKTMVQHCRHL